MDKATLLKNGFIKYLNRNSYYYKIPFANDCEIYYEIESNKFYLEDSGFLMHELNINSIEDIETFTNFFKTKQGV